MIEDYSGFPEWLEMSLWWIGLLMYIVFTCGMIWMFCMFTWFPEWEEKYEMHQTVKRHAALSTKLGRQATMKEYMRSLSNIDYREED